MPSTSYDKEMAEEGVVLDALFQWVRLAALNLYAFKLIGFQLHSLRAEKVHSFHDIASGVVLWEVLRKSAHMIPSLEPC
jgi:divalent metal cation (Fe/Co/Zn/Cd) transporter